MPTYSNNDFPPEYRIRQQDIPEEYTLHDYKARRGVGDFFRRTGPADKRSDEYVALRSIAILYLLFFILAELNIAYVSTLVGLTLHATLLVMICFLKPQPRTHKFPLLLVLTLPPLLRLFSLSIPLTPFRRELWYIIISLPAFIAVYGTLYLLRRHNVLTATKSNKAPRRPKNSQSIFAYNPVRIAEIGTRILQFGMQILVVATGPLIGWVLYNILPNVTLTEEFNWPTLFISTAIFLLSTGMLEELIFRRLLLDNVAAVFGAQLGGFYVSLLFATMYMGHRSVMMVPFVFVVSLFYSWVASSTEKIWGVSLSHGIANVCLFLIYPHYPQFLAALAQL